MLSIGGAKFSDRHFLHMDKGAASVNRIADLQNRPENLQLLAAQRALYNKAKLLKNIRFFGALIFSVVGPTVSFNQNSPDNKFWLAVVTGLFSLMQFMLLRNWEASDQGVAASIQEEFDTRVFSLQWNSSLGNRPEPEQVSRYAKKLKDQVGLKDWYSKNVAGQPHWRAVVLCQRTNLAWDANLQRYVAYCYVILLLTVLALLVAIAISFELSVKDALTSLAVPSLSALLALADEAIKHYSTATSKEALVQRTTATLRNVTGATGDLEQSYCRELQDAIWKLRAKQVPVPEQIYWFFRRSNEDEMNDAVQELS